MKRVSRFAFLVFLMACLPLLAAGQSRRADPRPLSSGIAPKQINANQAGVRLVSIPGGALVIGGESGDGILNLGKVSYYSPGNAQADASKGLGADTKTTRFGIALEAPSTITTGSAMLSAYLSQPSPNCAYFIDGIRLTTSPQVISPRVRYGVIGEHRLEIQVRKTAPAGRIQDSIVWMVIPEE